MVKPILLYGCEIWSFGNNDIIERVHLKFCKHFFNLKTKSTPNFMIYGEIGAYPMFVYIKLRMVNYWSKLINGKDNKLSLILYKYMYIKNVHANHGQYQSSWFDSVKSILDNCGFSNIWESQGNFNSTWLNITLKLKLFYKFQQEWRSNMENSLKRLYYKLFLLPIETGRWNGIYHGNRLCNICTDAEIGDEFLCILQCKSLENERKLHMRQYFSCRINTLKFGQQI
jgi:hypothetical protein